MNFTDFTKEVAIRRTLRGLSRQRVALVLQPGNVWVIENAVKDDKETDAALKTCYMRGWVEPIQNAIPKGDLTPDGRLPDGNIINRVGPFYRLTDSGWSVINRTQLMVLVMAMIGFLTLITTIG